LNDFTEGKYSEVIDDSSVKDSKQIKRVILTSGKVYYNLLTHKDINEITDTAIVRIEQYYPFPGDAIKSILSKYSGAAEIYWVQEEPENMGAWNFMFPKLLKLAGKKQKIKYVGRNESPSPAAGSSKMYQKNQDILVNNAFK
jgi:2-oxoglutarate dehydrogenase E1 component